MKLKFFATYRDFTRCKEADVTAPPDVWALLQHLKGQYGDAFGDKLLTSDGTDIGCETIILINGRNAGHLNGKDTPLSEADVVSIFPVVAGG
ncbi:MAG: MoaD family protein [Oscillospiraceae bacterium]|nr:MoaD family protein [Oscillospiraceae bacterium]